jgi:hypothetical protein
MQGTCGWRLQLHKMDGTRHLRSQVTSMLDLENPDQWLETAHPAAETTQQNRAVDKGQPNNATLHTTTFS